MGRMIECRRHVLIDRRAPISKFGQTFDRSIDFIGIHIRILCMLDRIDHGRSTAAIQARLNYRRSTQDGGRRGERRRGQKKK